MTEKLYYKDAYIKSFDAKVISSEPCSEGFDTVLDKTAFFPEEGGQYSDRGAIGSARVLRVYESCGIIHHICDGSLTPDSLVKACLDFDERYEKMQIHTGEHLLSGLFHSLYGYENVGFHLGPEEVTMDINAVLDEEKILRVEELANRIIYENVPVFAYFPDKEELKSLEYRSKLQLEENVRIVKIGEYDSCACCAPHVKASGEIGIIRILDFVKHRGGTRITMTAGIRAVRDYRERYEAVRRVSALLSVPKHQIAEGTERLLSDMESLKFELSRVKKEFYLKYASEVPETSGNLVLHFPDADFDCLRTLANELLPRISGILVLLSGKDGNIKHLTVSKNVDLGKMCADINKALSGRGGGRAGAIQGSFSASVDRIKEYFKA